MVETSVIMATYKESIECLKQSIESIINQTYNDFEFIIILDNPDNKEHIAFINDYVCKDERIKFYINDKNMGLTNTLNRGLELPAAMWSGHRILCRSWMQMIFLNYIEWNIKRSIWKKMILI